MKVHLSHEIRIVGTEYGLFCAIHCLCIHSISSNYWKILVIIKYENRFRLAFVMSVEKYMNSYVFIYKYIYITHL